MDNMGLGGKIDLFNNFYKDKTVLVTGHTGFKGSWLSIWLHELGANVIGYALDPYTERDNFVVTDLKNKIIDIRGDIRDELKLQKVINTYKPQIIFHLAAQPIVRLSYENPKETYEINVMGTLNVLECIRKCDSIKVGIFVTSDKCYENKEQIWPYRETDRLGGYDPYSSSKGCCELLISSYRNSFMNPNEYHKHGKSIASVRAGNVIGGGDWSKDRIIPDTIKALTSNKSIEIRNPNAIRPWQYILEPLYGYMVLGEKMWENGKQYASSWNFGPNYDSIISVSKVVELIIKKWGHGDWKNVSDNNLHESNLLSLDCSKSKNYLKWKPILNINQAIEYTIEWYKEENIENIYSICAEQIKRYTSELKIESIS